MANPPPGGYLLQLQQERDAAIARAERAEESCLKAERHRHELRIELAGERAQRQSLEKQRDRLVGLLNTLAERFTTLDARLDGIIEMLGARP